MFDKITPLQKKKLVVFIVAFMFVFAILVWDVLHNALYVKDAMFALAVIALLYWLERKHPLPIPVIIISFLPIFLHICGVSFNWFAILLFDFIGYDKLTHFSSSFALTVISFYWLISNSHKHYVKKAFGAVLIVLGLGSLNEINEFVGSQYLHITGPTMFSQGDSLPKIVGDFQIFDTWWDMIFNLGGTLLAWLVVVFATYYKHNIIEPTYASSKRRKR